MNLFGGNRLKIDFDKWIEKFLFIYKFIRPKFYHRITWFVVVSGVALMSTTLLEQLISYFLKINFEISVSGEDDVVWGFALVAIALTYHLITTSIYESVERADIRHVREIRKTYDINLLNKLLALLPSYDCMSFIRDYDFANSFHPNRIKNIEKFFEEWDNAECEFHDVNIENAKRELYSKANDFVMNIARYTALNDYGRLTAIPRHVDPEIDFPAWVRDEISQINNSATELYRSHQDFIRVSRDSLGDFQ